MRNPTNFGPQHPAAHGVLRLVLELDGEVIQRADPRIGLLRRPPRSSPSTAPTFRTCPTWTAWITCRCSARARVRAGDREATRHRVPLRAQYIRVMFDEITRILNHLLFLGTQGLDLGAMTVFLYCFRGARTCSTATRRCPGRACMQQLPTRRRVPELADSMPQYEPSRFRSEKT